jgi:hypothetical protein
VNTPFHGWLDKTPIAYMTTAGMYAGSHTGTLFDGTLVFSYMAITKDGYTQTRIPMRVQRLLRRLFVALDSIWTVFLSNLPMVPLRPGTGVMEGLSSRSSWSTVRTYPHCNMSQLICGLLGEDITQALVCSTDSVITKIKFITSKGESHIRWST